MSKVNSNGRGWDVELQQKRGQREGEVEKRTVDGEGLAELTQKHRVDNLFQDSCVDQAGIIRTLMGNCSPTKAAQRSHR